MSAVIPVIVAGRTYEKWLTEVRRLIRKDKKLWDLTQGGKKLPGFDVYELFCLGCRPRFYVSELRKDDELQPEQTGSDAGLT